MAAKQRVLICEHCGNNVLHEEKGKHCTEEDEDGYSGIWWAMFLCTTCRQPSFWRYETVHPGSQWEAENGDLTTNLLVMYPQGSRLTFLPAAIQKNYDKALKVKNIEPSSFAVMAGRTLEAVCNDQKAEGSSLHKKLEFLVKNGKIPGTLGKMADQIRALRNLGAHFDDSGDDVSKNDAETLFGFVEAILEYIYVAEAKVEALETRLNKKIVS